MNRYDQIQGLARDIASNVHVDPANRDAMADSLIQLCTAVVAAIGKGVAVKGESDLSEANDMQFELDTESVDYTDAEIKRHRTEFEAEQSEAVVKAHGMYLTGKAIQDVADNVAGHSLNPQVDLDRWDPPVWQHTDRRPVMFQHADERGVVFIPPAAVLCFCESGTHPDGRPWTVETPGCPTHRPYIDGDYTEGL